MIDSSHNFYSKMQNSKNYLLVKDDVGKPKPPIRILPNSGFAYGVKISRNKEDAGAVISSWAENLYKPKRMIDKDFKKLNILSIAEKQITAPQQRAFRKISGHRRMSSEEPRNHETGIDNVVYGMPLRPSTPIKAVLGNFYGNFASEQKNSAYSYKTKSACRQRKIAVEKKSEELKKDLFKLKKFLRVKAKTSTGRSKSFSQ